MSKWPINIRKIVSTSLLNVKMQIKTTTQIANEKHVHPLEWLELERQKTPNVSKHGNAQRYTCFGKLLAVSTKAELMHSLWPKRNAHMYNPETNNRMLIAVFLGNVPDWKPCKYPRIKQIVIDRYTYTQTYTHTHTHTQEYYATIKSAPSVSPHNKMDKSCKCDVDKKTPDRE